MDKKTKIGLVVGVVIILAIAVGLGMNGDDRDDGEDKDETSIIVDLEDKRSGTDYYDKVTIYADGEKLGNMEFQKSKEFAIDAGNHTITVEGTAIINDADINVWETQITIEEGETVTADDWETPEER